MITCWLVLACLPYSLSFSPTYARAQATIGAALEALAGSRMTLELLRATGAGKVVNRAAKALAKASLTIWFAGDMACRARALIEQWKVVEQQGILAEALERQAIPSKVLEQQQALALERRAKRARLESGPDAAGHTAGDTANDAVGDGEDGEDAPLSARAAALRPTADGGGGAGLQDRTRDRTPVFMPARFARLPNPAAIRSADLRAEEAARRLKQAAVPSALPREAQRCRAAGDYADHWHRRHDHEPSYAEQADAHRAVLGGLDAHLARVRQMREGTTDTTGTAADTLRAASRQADAMRQMRESVPAAPVVRCCPLGHALVESIRAAADELEGHESIRVAAFLRCDTCDLS